MKLLTILALGLMTLIFGNNAHSQTLPGKIETITTDSRYVCMNPAVGGGGAVISIEKMKMWMIQNDTDTEGLVVTLSDLKTFRCRDCYGFNINLFGSTLAGHISAATPSHPILFTMSDGSKQQEMHCATKP